MNYFFLLIVQPRYILLQVVNKEVKKKNFQRKEYEVNIFFYD